MEERRHACIHAKGEGKEVLRVVGTAECRELTEAGPKHNEWVFQSPAELCAGVAKGIRKAMRLSEDV